VRRLPAARCRLPTASSRTNEPWAAHEDHQLLARQSRRCRPAQARLVVLAPELAPISLSLNSSAIYLGSATGAAVGALVIAHPSVERLGWVAAGISLAALLTVLGTGQVAKPPIPAPRA